MAQILEYIRRDVVSHFKIRASCWFMSFTMLGIGIQLCITDHLFANHPLYIYMAQLGVEQSWGKIFILISLIRLAALTINGLSSKTWWTPYVRMITSAISSVVWAQIAVGVFWYASNHIGVIIIPTLVAFEVFNTSTSAAECIHQA